MNVQAWKLTRPSRPATGPENAWGSKHPSETALLLACARTGIDTGSAERIQGLVRRPLNWEWLAGAAEDQGVFPLLYRSIKRSAPEAIPSASLAVWQARFYSNAARNLYLAHELSQLLSLFEKDGICALPYKGPLLATTVYGNLALRKAGDLDLLVHRRNFRRTKELLFSQGYQTQMALTWKDHLVHPTDGLNIDLHKEIAPRRYKPQVSFDDLWHRHIMINIDGNNLPTFCLEDLLIALCLDIVRDTGEATYLRLFKLCDVAEVVRSYNAANWELLLQKVKQIGARRALFVGLRAADDLLGISMPTDIRDLVFSDTAVETIARHTAAMVRDGPPTEKRFPHQTRIILKVRERARDKALAMLLTIGEAFSRTTRNVRAQLTYTPNPRQ